MSSHVHIALYNALREAGASEENAKLASAEHDLATKEDIANLRGELRASHAGIIRPLYTFGGLITALLIKLAFFP